MTGTGAGKAVSPGEIDEWTRHLWHTSNHQRMVVTLGMRMRRVVNEMREAAGLPLFGSPAGIPDAEFGECSVHAYGCLGQETHGGLTP